MQQQIPDIVAAALLTFNEMCWICVLQIAEVCAKYWGLCWNRRLSDTVWALKWGNKCSNIPFRLEDTAI